ncbi:hypothetical protein [Streptomyces sp. NPDC088180]|uniref:hypothetical protein n=1 Tax=Streptomyces sp. NPDC088180 TaxID=3365837 RepID=UPI003814B2D4
MLFSNAPSARNAVPGLIPGLMLIVIFPPFPNDVAVRTWAGQGSRISRWELRRKAQAATSPATIVSGVPMATFANASQPVNPPGDAGQRPTDQE